MKIIGTFGGVVIASVALLQPAQGGSRGSNRSSSPSYHTSGSARHFAGPTRNFSNSGGARFHSPSARFSSGGTFRNRSFSHSGPRFAANRTSALNLQRTAFRNRVYSGPRLATNRSTALRSHTFNSNRSRVVARYGGNWHRNWDRRRDHFWHGRRCHWHNNSWVIFDTGFFYPYGYGYYYPYSNYAYDDGGYYDDAYASNEYSQQSYQPQSESDNGDADSNISEVQSALSREGYYSGATDGSMGPGTQSALRRYQRDHGLPVTGRIDRAVINALGLR